MLVGLIIAIVAALGLGFGWLIYVFNYNGSGSGVKTEDYKKLESEMSRQKEIVASQREELMRNRENLDELVREKSRIEANLEVLQELRGNLEGERNALKTETDLKNERIKELEIEKAQWQGGEKGRQYEEEEVKKRVEKLRKELEELCERHRLAIRGEEEEENGVKVRFRFELDGKEKKVCSLIREIGDLYPSLASDLYKIEWSKVWMPKLQKVRGQLDGVRGVYRLIKIGEDNVCYVGKAENIKERWYQHCKKMLGVDAAGGEWLYKCRPDQLEWTVLEVVEDGVRLDEVERYWIDFYRANEKGLNRI